MTYGISTILPVGNCVIKLPKCEEIAPIANWKELLFYKLKENIALPDDKRLHELGVEIDSSSKHTFSLYFKKLGESVFRADVSYSQDRLKMNLFEHFCINPLLDYKLALLSIHGFAKKIGCRELEALILDRDSCASRAKALEDAMNYIGLQKRREKAGEYAYLTYFSGVLGKNKILKK